METEKMKTGAGDKNWTPVWHQALSGALLKGRIEGKDRTVRFVFTACRGGDSLRIRFGNRMGEGPYRIREMTVAAGGQRAHVTRDGQQDFEIPPGGRCCSNGVKLSVRAGDEVEIRMCYRGYMRDINWSWQNTWRSRGNAASGSGLPKEQKSFLEKRLGISAGIPAIETVEIETTEPANVIVAFGDSITAGGRWTRPLEQRLRETYGDRYFLMNAGISGNCWLGTQKGFFSDVFGRPGIERAAWDVLETEHLHTVMFGLGVNDLACLTEENRDLICFERYTETVTELAETLRGRKARMVMQTITPRRGCTSGTFTEEMEELRCRINEWIWESDLFAYVFDADAAVRDPRDPHIYDERYHQGDRLHPSEEGGRRLADAIDLERLTGEKIRP